MQIHAVSLDLDDTLWPVLPALIEAERCVDAWLREHHPTVATAWPIEAMRELRDRIALENTHLSHDFSEQRRLTIRHAFAACGIDDAPVDELWSIYFAARNRVELYPDSLAALERIAAHLPIASISNGNADLEVIGLDHFFRERLSASGEGVAKPHPQIFRAAAERLGIAPQHILHVGDDPLLDVVGAREAGLATAWLNRTGERWSHGPAPDLEFTDMTALADWLDALRASDPSIHTHPNAR
ncbi:putative hydrolase of the HAD superfamily [Luteibacter rhizovicinus]|uniref:Putative hydrolase of the HAD superfamily n=1 Tax=Luteibacter rhizovicinus TaxID=242606 RepID=A0A4R3YHX3_9GAMM|nr:HAD family hydrolase [Luteibacter rhizovicinus]TCV91612.1 putative hydrolase of the HAD superfamily [Luteibacter rhizovicinus]